jgi:ribosomal RNA assembly protein
MIDFVRIPEERVRIFKRDKKFKENLEKFTESKIRFNEDVEIECEDTLKLLRIKLVVQAFGRGFDSEASMNLLDEDYYLEIIEIKEYSGKSRERMLTLKGRVIGTQGKTKKMLEDISETKLAIYGKTICIIGTWDRVMIAKKAIEMILTGRLHTTVYKFLEKQRR